MGGIGEQDAQERAGRESAVHRTGEPLPTQPGKEARVVDVSVGEHHRVDLVGRVGQGFPVQAAILPRSLEETTIHHGGEALPLQQVLGAGYAPAGTENGNPHGGLPGHIVAGYARWVEGRAPAKSPAPGLGPRASGFRPQASGLGPRASSIELPARLSSEATSACSPRMSVLQLTTSFSDSELARKPSRLTSPWWNRTSEDEPRTIPRSTRSRASFAVRYARRWS